MQDVENQEEVLFTHKAMADWNIHILFLGISMENPLDWDFFLAQQLF